MRSEVLTVAPCSAEAARYAVEHWHYSGVLPTAKLVRLGVWENDDFVGVVIFARGATPSLAKRWGFSQTEACELARVALVRKREVPTTAVVAAALKELRSSNPGMRLVVSFADPNVGHVGTLYMAGNWIYTGQTAPSHEVYFEGRWIHNRMLRPTGFGTLPRVARLSDAEKAKLPRRTRLGKFRYVYPLDRAARRIVMPAQRAFPRGSRLDGEPSGLRLEGAGSTPATRS